MAFFQDYYFTCGSCHQEKMLRININLPERPEICNECKRKKRAKKKEDYLKLFKEKTLEEKLLFLAEEIYEIKNSSENNYDTINKRFF